MADFNPALRPIEPSPLTPLRERQRRGNERAFDLERELGEHAENPQPEQPVLTTDGASKRRNVFNRRSAAEQLEDEEADEVESDDEVEEY